MRLEQPGETVSADSLKKYSSTSSFFAKRKSSTASVKVAIALSKKPQLATHDWMVSLHKVLKQTTTEGLSLHRTARPLRPCDDPLEPGGTLELVLFTISDQLQKQLIGVFFGQWALNLLIDIYSKSSNVARTDPTDRIPRNTRTTTEIVAVFGSPGQIQTTTTKTAYALAKCFLSYA